LNLEAKPGEIILIDKPLGWTSFQAVKKVKWLKKAKKAGHAGTLDPLATGLLIICTEKSTKKISAIQDAEKEYTGTITLGATTPSYDLETEPTDFKDYSSINFDQIIALKSQFTGLIMQAPPLFSAIKIEGQRAYKLAREGSDLELKQRPVTIANLDFTRFEGAELDFIVSCSKGTYIRSLANDIGKALGCGAYLSALRRTRIGEFSIADANTPEALENVLNSGNH
jgi:tRNA pseudouridine55 synthase